VTISLRFKPDHVEKVPEHSVAARRSLSRDAAWRRAGARTRPSSAISAPRYRA